MCFKHGFEYGEYGLLSQTMHQVQTPLGFEGSDLVVSSCQHLGGNLEMEGDRFLECFVLIWNDDDFITRPLKRRDKHAGK